MGEMGTPFIQPHLKQGSSLQSAGIMGTHISENRPWEGKGPLLTPSSAKAVVAVGLSTRNSFCQKQKLDSGLGWDHLHKQS